MTDNGEKREIKIVDKRAQENSGHDSQGNEEMDANMAQFAAAEASGAGADATEGSEPQSAEDTGNDGHEDAPLLEEVVEEGNEETIEFWQQQAQQNLDLAQRAQAELANHRRMAQKDLQHARVSAIERLLEDFFPALDGLAQAAQAFKDKADGEDAMVDGVRRTIKALEGAMQKHGITKIKEAGVPFNAELHHPLSVEESDEVEHETVAEVYVEGYRLGDNVLKPAMVKVFKASS